jgi:hypothetical protein
MDCRSASSPGLRIASSVGAAKVLTTAEAARKRDLMETMLKFYKDTRRFLSVLFKILAEAHLDFIHPQQRSASFNFKFVLTAV